MKGVKGQIERFLLEVSNRKLIRKNLILPVYIRPDLMMRSAEKPRA